MPLTATHDEKRILTREQVARLADSMKTIEQILALDGVLRAEVLDYLYDLGNVAVTMKVGTGATQKVAKDGITFTLARDHRGGTQTFAIPGAEKPPKRFPLWVGVHVASSRDEPQFGGAHFAGGYYDSVKDRFIPVAGVPQNPNLVEITLIRDE